MSANKRGKVQGASSKYDRGLSILEQYDLVCENSWRGRGSLLCQTDQGLKMIIPYTGSVKRLEKINDILIHLKESGYENSDIILKNKEGGLISTDREGDTYLVKDWWDARECDVRSESDVLKCMKQMAYLHKDMYLQMEEGCEQENLLSEYEKHNRQLKKMRVYIRHRKQKNLFEYRYLESVERYLEYGTSACHRLEESGYEMHRQKALKEGSICHGMCNQHNFLVSGDQVALVHFDHFFLGDHMADVAQFLRKIMEKHNWNPKLGQRMLDAYSYITPITENQWEELSIRMAYPEKYWKISNFYYNKNKAFLPEKNMDKLNVFILQEERWLDFLDTIF